MLFETLIWPILLRRLTLTSKVGSHEAFQAKLVRKRTFFSIWDIIFVLGEMTFSLREMSFSLFG